jgi:hypothetical protein
MLRELVIRRNATDLADFVDRARQKYSPLGAKFAGNPVTITFPSGATIYTGHLATPDAYTKYQGWEIHRLLMEEVTHIQSERLYEKLLGSVRSTVPGIKTQVFLTTNPGGAGHEWVKERFKIGQKPNRMKWATDDGTTRIYINATVMDNPHLLEADPKYLKYLQSLPDGLRQQWLEGSWDEFDVEGAYYITQIKQAEREGRVNVVPIEASLPTYTAWDLGIADSTSIWVFQVFKKEIRFIGYYENNGEGLQHYVNWLKDFRSEHGFTYTDHFVPHDAQVRELTSGQSRLDSLRRMGVKCKLVPNYGIMDGIELAREVIGRSWFDADRCKDGVRCIKNYRKEFDEKLNRYKDKPLHDWASHGSDAFRYAAVAIKTFVREDEFKLVTPKTDWDVF